MAANVLGRAYIEVHADTKPFGKELEESVAAISTLTEKEAKASGRKIGRKINEGIQSEDLDFGTATKRALLEMEKEAKKGGGFFSRLFGGNRRAVLKDAEKLGGETGQTFGGAIVSGAKKFGSILIKLFSDPKINFGSKFSDDIESPDFDSVFREMERKAKRGGGFFSRLFGGRRSVLKDAEKIGDEAGRTFAGSILAGAKGIGSIGGKVFSVIGGAFSAAKGIVSSVSSVFSILLIGIIPALIGVVYALTLVLGPLLNVVGLLPGALGLVAAAIVPVIVGFQGFGNAISAIMSHDPKKIAEALKTLSPHARATALSFQKMLPFLHQIQQSTQENIFKSLSNVLPRIKDALGSIVKIGFDKVGASFGNFLGHILLLAENPQVQAFFKTMFSLASFTFDALSGPIDSLLAAFAGIGTASGPWLEKLINGLANLISEFANFLQNSIADGSFDTFMGNFMKALDSLKELGKAGLNLLDALIGGPEQKAEAMTFFDGLVANVNKLADFFRSDEGKQALKGLIVLAGGLSDAFTLAALAVGKILAAIGHAADAVESLINKMVEAGILKKEISHGIIGKSNRNEGGSPHGHAQGGIFSSEHLARIAEGGKREVVIPLTDRSRAMALADRSGLTSMINNNNDVAVNVYIGDEQIQARVDRRVAAGIKGLTSAMKYGPRPIGIGG